MEYPEGEIFIDPDKLPSPDEILTRWQLEKEGSAHKLMQKARRIRRNRLLIVGGMVLGAFTLCAHAAWQLDSYRFATVSAATGLVFVQEGSAAHTLHSGERISLTTGTAILPVFCTGPGESLMIDLRGARLLLLENTKLAIRQADYRSAPVRRFDLQSGGVIALVNPRHRAGAVFEIRAGTVRALAKGTRYGVVYAGAGGVRQVIVATQEGSVRVVRGDAQQMVPVGEQLSAFPEQVSDGHGLPASIQQRQITIDMLAQCSRGMADVPLTNGFLTWLSGIEEGTIIPAVEGLTAFIHLPTYLNDRRAILNALGGMQALCTLVQTTGASEEGPPASVTLNTLEELGMTPKDRQRILGQFQGHQLIRYRRLSGGGYEFTAQAQDAAHSLVRGSNGAAVLVGNDDTVVTNTNITAETVPLVNSSAPSAADTHR